MFRQMCIMLIIGLVASAASGAALFGTTDANLVRIDPADPNNVTVIGPHNMPDGYRPFDLSHDPAGDRLLGVVIDENDTPDDSEDQFLYAFDLTSGQATELVVLGNESNATNVYEGITYISPINATVVTFGDSGSAVTNQFKTIDPNTGSTSSLVNNTVDNDYIAYDPNADTIYSLDLNFNTGRTDLIHVDRTTGANTDLGDVSFNQRNIAVDPDTGLLFSVNRSNNHLIRMDVDLANSTFSETDLGLLAGNDVGALTFIPEPTSLALLGLGALAMLRRRRANP